MYRQQISYEYINRSGLTSIRYIQVPEEIVNQYDFLCRAGYQMTASNKDFRLSEVELEVYHPGEPIRFIKIAEYHDLFNQIPDLIEKVYRTYIYQHQEVCA